MIAPWITEPDVDVEAILDAEKPVDDPWYPQSAGEADWCMGKLALVESELDAIEAQRAEWQLQLDDWLVTVTRRPKKGRELFVGYLTEYARRQREETGTATLTLPGGKVTSRRNPAKLLVTDPEAVLAWARACAVEVVKQVVRLDELRRVVSIRDDLAVSRDGEVVAGLDVEPEHVSFKVVAK
jgi:hypothetical protein